MEEYIYHIISKYIDRDEIITKEGLNSIVYIYKNIKRLNNYIYDVDFENKEILCAVYSNRKILYNYDNIVSKYSETSAYEYCFDLVRILLHEMNHAKHTKLVHDLSNPDFRNRIYKNPYNSIYSLLITDSIYYFSIDFNKEDKESFKFFNNNNNSDLNEEFRKLYEKNHDIFPDERICTLEAFKFLKQLIYKYEKDEKKFKRYIDYLNVYYYLYLIKDYELNDEDDVLSPVENFIRKFSFEDQRKYINKERNKLERIKPYDKISIMNLGLRIDLKTYSNMLDYLIYLSRNDAEIEEKVLKKGII